MKIVWLGIDYHDPDLLAKTWYRHNYQAILDWLRLKAEVVCYANHYCGDWKREHDVSVIETKEDPDAYVIYDFEAWKNLDRIEKPKIVRCSDPWDSYKQQLQFINDNRIDVVLIKFWNAVDYFQRMIKHPCMVVGFPHQVDERIFKPLGLERDIDVWCSGNFNRHTHPIRHSALRTLPYRQDIKAKLSTGHRYSLKELVRIINCSKIGIFDDVHKRNLGTSFYGRTLGKWAVGRWWENMSCKTLCLSNRPDYYNQLHLIPNENFVEVNQHNFAEKILYYLEHEDERKEIAEKGYETFLQYHTCEKRVTQMLEIIEKCLP